MTGVGALFLRTNGALHALQEQRLSVETDLQQLLAEYPELIPLDRIDSDLSGPPLLITREANLGGMELDHLFVDAKATPILVECKPAYNREQRRQVVAQMLDYAANAHLHWDATSLRTMLEARCNASQLDATELVAGLDTEFASEDDFWSTCQTNLRAGNMRLLFVADTIGDQLQLIVEFLNERMVPTEVLAMEVIQYRAEDGQEMLQSRLVGQTEAAVRVKGRGRRPEVLQVLMDAPNDPLLPGQALWYRPEKLPQTIRPSNPADERLRVTVQKANGSPVLHYMPPGASDPITEVPSRMWNHVRRSFEPDFSGMRARSVSERYALEPGGPRLSDVAKDRGLWD